MVKNLSDKSLDLSRFDRSVQDPHIPKDSHFGLGTEVWESAQKLVGLLGIDINLQGDLGEEDVTQMIETAKGAELQVLQQQRYSKALEDYLANLKKIVEIQAQRATTLGKSRVDIATIEKQLGVELAKFNSQFQQLMGEQEAEIATVQDELGLKLNAIGDRFKKSAEQRRTETQAKDKEQTEFQIQKTSLGEKFKQVSNQKLTVLSGGRQSTTRKALRG